MKIAEFRLNQGKTYAASPFGSNTYELNFTVKLDRPALMSDLLELTEKIVAAYNTDQQANEVHRTGIIAQLVEQHGFVRSELEQLDTDTLIRLDDRVALVDGVTRLISQVADDFGLSIDEDQTEEQTTNIDRFVELVDPQDEAYENFVREALAAVDNHVLVDAIKSIGHLTDHFEASFEAQSHIEDWAEEKGIGY